MDRKRRVGDCTLSDINEIKYNLLEITNMLERIALALESIERRT